MDQSCSPPSMDFLPTTALFFIIEDEFGLFYGGSEGEILDADLRVECKDQIARLADVVPRSKAYSAAGKQAMQIAKEYLQSSIRALIASDIRVTIELRPTPNDGMYSPVLGEHVVSHRSLDSYYYHVRARELHKWVAKQPYAATVKFIAADQIQTSSSDQPREENESVPVTLSLFDADSRAGAESLAISDGLRLWNWLPLSQTVTSYNEEDETARRSSFGSSQGLEFRPRHPRRPHPSASVRSINATSVLDIPVPQDFRPSYQLLAKKGLLEERSYQPAEDDGGRSKYKGSKFSGSYLEKIVHLPDNMNSALWIYGIPINITYSEFFSYIDVGKVVSLYFVPPGEYRPYKAANLVFASSSAARAFWQRSKSSAGIWMDGKRINVEYNKHGVHSESHPRPYQSRVIEIEGPAGSEMMSFEYWDRYFRSICIFDYEGVQNLQPVIEGNVRLEFRFVRIDSQAETIFRAIRRTAEFQGVIHARYGRDPCDPSPQI